MDFECEQTNLSSLCLWMLKTEWTTNVKGTSSKCESIWAVDVHDGAIWRRENSSSPLALGVHEGMLGEGKSSAYPYSNRPCMWLKQV
ncbi:hypothetical protein GOBAR_AA30891 [Gossypium barbadense]|uniref:Uncharacterized protein n=1 Tax=Gossypium barbadense TaxID=3634 RepID=A0A2P5WFG3_GOSBA|nr:hypothetical protein GOBAR_AA30891 [Gossypium barbadense]